jgi:transcriptional regulator with XRE-family HTH domain
VEVTNLKSIRELREALGLKQQDIATACGVTQSRISEWENGGGVPTTDKILPLASALGVGAAEVLRALGCEVPQP